VELLNAKGVPSAPSSTIKETFENEQGPALVLRCRSSITRWASLRLQRPPVTFLAHAALECAQPRRNVGQHTDEILGELGFSADDIKGLRRRTRWLDGHGRALFTR